MILTNEEKTYVKILRLVKKISIKHGEGYYSVDTTPRTINKKYYFPKKGHQEFSDPKETINSLKRLLEMSTAEYKYDLKEILKKKAELKKQKKELLQEIKQLEKDYTYTLKQIKKNKGE